MSQTYEQGLVVDVLELEVLEPADMRDLFAELVRVEQLVYLYADLCELVREERRYAGLRRAERRRAEALLLVGVEQDVVGHENLRPVADEHLRTDPTRAHVLKLVHELGYVESDAVREDVRYVRIEDAGGQQVQCETPVLVYYRVPGVRSALKADDYIRLSCEHVRGLALAFVAPVCSYDRSNHDKLTFPSSKIAPLRSKARRNSEKATTP